MRSLFACGLVVGWMWAAPCGGAFAAAPAETRPGRPTSRAAERPATQPATAPASRPVDLEAAITRGVAELVEQFRRRRYKDRQAAQTRLLDLHRAYVNALTRYADDADPEVRARVLDLLGRLVAITRFERVLAKLPKPQRGKLVRLKKAHPQIVAGIFSLNWTRRLEAVKEIRKLKDDDGMAEPLLILCVNHPWRQLATAAIHAIGEKEYRSDATVDALVKVLLAAPREDWQRGWYDRNNPPTHLAALNALRNLKPKRAAPALLALMGSGPSFDVRRDMALGEVLAATGEKRAIPVLLGRLKNTSVRSTWSINNVRITIAPSDPALLALATLTGQMPAAYGFISQGHSYGPNQQQTIYGFPDKKARDKAIEKFKAWWTKHKDAAPYRGLTPLAVPDLDKPDAPPPPMLWRT